MNVKLQRKFYVISCPECGIDFAVTDDYDDHLRDCHNTFYCPNGHPQSYHDKTDAEKVTEELIQVCVELKEAECRAKTAECSQRALRGVITKMKGKTP